MTWMNLQTAKMLLKTSAAVHCSAALTSCTQVLAYQSRCTLSSELQIKSCCSVASNRLPTQQSTFNLIMHGFRMLHGMINDTLTSSGGNTDAAFA